MWTWPMAGLIWLNKRGFEVQNIEKFDYHRFAEEGEEYLIEKYGVEIAKEQIENSDLAQERQIAKQFTDKIKTQNRPATLGDIETYLNEGYICVANVNARALNKKTGYAGHFVVIKGIKNGTLRLHDPGLPASKDRELSYEQFDTA